MRYIEATVHALLVLVSPFVLSYSMLVFFEALDVLLDITLPFSLRFYCLIRPLY